MGITKRIQEAAERERLHELREQAWDRHYGKGQTPEHAGQSSGRWRPDERQPWPRKQ